MTTKMQNGKIKRTVFGSFFVKQKYKGSMKFMVTTLQEVVALDNGGTTANHHGSNIESLVENLFKSKHYECEKYSTYIKNPTAYSTNILLKNVPFFSIYEHRGKTEFLVKSASRENDIRIECKWQQSAGSVDEKLPYLYLNCVESFPEKEIIIIIDGGGFKEGAIRWLRDAVENRKYMDENDDKIIRVFNIAEFITWFNRNIK